MPRVFDCVILESRDQLDLLEARFHEFRDIPEVTHVICEAETDYHGNPKPKHFSREEKDDRFLPWHGRWNHVLVYADELPSDCDPRGKKDALRDRLAHGFNGDPDDIVMHGNIDEIPAMWMVSRLARGESELPVTMSMKHCAGHAGVILPGEWHGTAAHQRQHIGSFSGLRRRRKEFPLVITAGTRLSGMGAEYTEGIPLREEVSESWPRYIREGLCPGEWWPEEDFRESGPLAF